MTAGRRTDRPAIRPRPGILVALSLLATGCENPVRPGPPFSEPIALVRMHGPVEQDEMHRLLAIGLHSHRALCWSPSIMFRIERTVLSPDGELLYVLGDGPGGWKESQIAVLDTRTLTITQREFFADSGGYRLDHFDGLGVSGTSALVVSPDGSELFIGGDGTGRIDPLAPSSMYTGYGIAVYDADLDELPSIDLSGIEVQQFNFAASDPPALNMVAVAPNGELLVATGAMLAELWGFQSGRVFVVDPSSREVRGVIELQGELAASEILIP